MFHRNAKPPATSLPNMDTIDDVMDAIDELGGNALSFAPTVHRADRTIVLAALHAGPGTALQYASSELRSDPDVVRAAVHADSDALAHAGLDLRGDPQFMTEMIGGPSMSTKHLTTSASTVAAAVANTTSGTPTRSLGVKSRARTARKNKFSSTATRSTKLTPPPQRSPRTRSRDQRRKLLALRFASASLLSDPVFMLAAVNREGGALQFASEALLRNFAFMLALASSDVRTLEKAHESVLSNAAFMLVVCGQHGGKALRLVAAGRNIKSHPYAHICGDPAIVMAAVKVDGGDALQYAADNLTSDPIFMAACVRASSEVKKQRQEARRLAAKDGQRPTIVGERDVGGHELVAHGTPAEISLRLREGNSNGASLLSSRDGEEDAGQVEEGQQTTTRGRFNRWQTHQLPVWGAAEDKKQATREGKVEESGDRAADASVSVPRLRLSGNQAVHRHGGWDLRIRGSGVLARTEDCRRGRSRCDGIAEEDFSGDGWTWQRLKAMVSSGSRSRQHGKRQLREVPRSRVLTHTAQQTRWTDGDSQQQQHRQQQGGNEGKDDDCAESRYNKSAAAELSYRRHRLGHTDETEANRKIREEKEMTDKDAEERAQARRDADAKAEEDKEDAEEEEEVEEVKEKTRGWHCEHCNEMCEDIDAMFAHEDECASNPAALHKAGPPQDAEVGAVTVNGDGEEETEEVWMFERVGSVFRGELEHCIPNQRQIRRQEMAEAAAAAAMRPMDPVCDITDTLRHASDSLVSNPVFMLLATMVDGDNAQYASPSLLHDLRWMRAAATEASWRVIIVAPEEIRDDRAFVISCVTQYGDSLQWASMALREDPKTCIAAVKQYVAFE